MHNPETVTLSAHPGLAGGFGIARVDGGREFVYVDDVFSGDVLERAEDVAITKRIWDELRVEALPGKQSIEMIEEVAEKWGA